jgi:hypothetical protein
MIVSLIAGFIFLMLIYRLIIYVGALYHYLGVCKTTILLIHLIDKDFVSKNPGFEVEMINTIKPLYLFLFDLACWKMSYVLDSNSRFYKDLLDYQKIDVIKFGKAFKITLIEEKKSNEDVAS